MGRALGAQAQQVARRARREREMLDALFADDPVHVRMQRRIAERLDHVRGRYAHAGHAGQRREPLAQRARVGFVAAMQDRARIADEPGAQRVLVALVAHAAVAYPHEIVDHAQLFVGMADHRDARAARAMAQQVDHDARIAAVEPRERLVEHGQLRPVRERDVQVHALALPLRQRAARLVEQFGDAERVGDRRIGVRVHCAVQRDDLRHTQMVRILDLLQLRAEPPQ